MKTMTCLPMQLPLRTRMKSIRRTFTFCAGVLAFGIGPAMAVDIKIQRHFPLNLFDTGEAVRFEVKTSGELPGGGVLAVLTNEYGEEVDRKSVAEPGTGFEVDFGRPGRGFYELTVSFGDQSDKVSLGVMEFVDRTAREVREGGYVFGLKWWQGIQNQAEMAEAMTRLGLQWTRIIQDEGRWGPKTRLTIKEILGDYPMNAVIKIERFPKEVFDEERYGPFDEYLKKNRAWSVRTIPHPERYRAWLTEKLADIPEEQKVFEIWNEPWDKMAPEDFAEICKLAADIILDLRPDAIIGPNLKGKTGKYEYDAMVIKAGGMKRMNMVALHPYSGSEDREWFREYRQWLKKELGRDIPVYITEYGSHSTPEGPQAQTEMDMARNVTRRSVVRYAGGVASLIPHSMGSAEDNPTYWDDWMGFVRKKKEEPKPVLIAHANAARMIDGSEYLGDLWFGPEIEAFVFDRRGEPVMVLWTRDDSYRGKEENVARKEIEIDTGTETVLLTDMMGRETVLKTENGKLRLTLDESPVYLTGFSRELLAGVSRELRPDRWPQPENPPKNIRQTPKFVKIPDFDGKFDDWKGAVEVGHINPSVNAADASGVGYIAWDDEYLYYGSKVTDNEMHNPQHRTKLYRGDSIELFISTEPRDTGSGFGPNDHQFILTPTSPNGEPVIAEMVVRESGTLEDVAGAKYYAGPTGNGWAIELAIPWSRFNGFTPEPGARLLLDMRLNDEDKAHKRWSLDPHDNPSFSVFDPVTWSTLEITE